MAPADRVPAPPRSYLVYSLALFAVLLAMCVVMALGMQSAVHYVESYVVDVSGKGLTQSAAALSESLNRVLFEHTLQSQTIAQGLLMFSSDSDRLGAYLRTLKATLPDYMDIEVVDARGKVTASTVASQIGTDVAQRMWFKAFLKNVTPDLRGNDLFDSSRRTMVFPTPMVGEEGQFLGAVVLQVGFQSMEFLLEANKRSSTLRSTGRVEYQLVAQDGTLLYDSMSFGKVMNRSQAVKSAPINGMAKPGYREELHPQKNVPIVMGYAPVNRYGQVPGWQWTVLIRVDRDSILAPFHRFVATLMIWAGLALIGLIGALLWIIGRLKRASQGPSSPTPSLASAASPETLSRVPPLQDLEKATRSVPGHSAIALRPEQTARSLQSPAPLALDPAQWDDLRRWVRLAEVNRVCLFKNHHGEDKELWVSRRYEWIGLGEVARTEWSQWFSWSLRAKGFTRWEHQLSQGLAISGPVSTFPPAESDALASCDIRTVLVVPLMMDGEWWGFVEFDHCFTDRLWSKEEQESLKAVVNLLQTVIHRGGGEENLSRALGIMDTVLESTADGLLVVDEEGVLINFNQRLISMWNMPDAVTESRLTEELMSWMMRQLKVPDVLLRTMSELGGEPDAESYDILELQDGRFVERFSKPRREGDQSRGRIWIFRESIASNPSASRVHSSQ